MGNVNLIGIRGEETKFRQTSKIQSYKKEESFKEKTENEVKKGIKISLGN